MVGFSTVAISVIKGVSTLTTTCFRFRFRDVAGRDCDSSYEPGGNAFRLKSYLNGLSAEVYSERIF